MCVFDWNLLRAIHTRTVSQMRIRICKREYLKRRAFCRISGYFGAQSGSTIGHSGKYKNTYVWQKAYLAKRKCRDLYCCCCARCRFNNTHRLSNLSQELRREEKNNNSFRVLKYDRANGIKARCVPRHMCARYFQTSHPSMKTITRLSRREK